MRVQESFLFKVSPLLFTFSLSPKMVYHLTPLAALALNQAMKMGEKWLEKNNYPKGAKVVRKGKMYVALADTRGGIPGVAVGVWMLVKG